MKRLLSFLLLILFSGAVTASAAGYEKTQLYEAFEIEEVLDFEVEEESETETESGTKEYLFKSSHSNLNLAGGGAQESFDFQFLFVDSPTATLCGLFFFKACAIRQQVLLALNSFWRPPFFILYSAFRAEC
jgi:hypothetical protein